MVVSSVCEILDEIYPRISEYSHLIEYVTDRPGHDQRYAVDSSKIMDDLNWKPKNNFRML